jgi:hypothetical protein
MRAARGYFLAHILKAVDAVGQGLELRPVTGPVKDISLVVSVVLIILFIGAKVAMGLTNDTFVRQTTTTIVTVAFMLGIAVLLLQWNRSLLWHRSRSDSR